MGTHPIFESDFDCLTEKMSGIGGDANTMSTINRPTSRVLAPPGGGSSNIFGGPAEPAAPSKNTNRSNQQTCNIFGQPIVDHSQAKTITPKAAPQPSAQPVSQPVSNNEPSNEHNGSFYTGYAEKQINPKRTSTKVHAPPGGHSSISFG